MGTHSALLKGIAHKGSHAETRAFRIGVVSLPSDCFTRFGNPAWPGGRTAYFAAFVSWPGVLPKNAESLRDSDAHDAHRCPEASRPRRAAWSFFTSVEIGICTHCSRYFFRFSCRSSLCCSCASLVSARSFSARNCFKGFRSVFRHSVFGSVRQIGNFQISLCK